MVLSCLPGASLVPYPASLVPPKLSKWSFPGFPGASGAVGSVTSSLAEWLSGASRAIQVTSWCLRLSAWPFSDSWLHPEQSESSLALAEYWSHPVLF